MTTIPEGTRLAEATRAHLVGWRIPDGIPLSPDTAIVPLRPDPDMVRAAARALHTLLVRSCPDTVILVGMRQSGTRPSLIASGWITTPLGTVAIDAARAARIVPALRGRIEVFTGERLGAAAGDPAPAPDGIETIPLLLQVLAPGCRILPLLLVERSDPSPREIGRTLAELFVDESVALVAATELSSEPPAPGDSAQIRERLRVRDAELIRPLLDLDIDEVVRVAGEGGASAPAVLEAAIAHARARGAKNGHLIEYVRSGGEQPSDPWTGRAGIVF